MGDDWKVSDRLTLNLGTRYTLNFPSTEVEQSGRGLQPEHAGAGLSAHRRANWNAAISGRASGWPTGSATPG